MKLRAAEGSRLSVLVWAKVEQQWAMAVNVPAAFSTGISSLPSAPSLPSSMCCQKQGRSALFSTSLTARPRPLQPGNDFPALPMQLQACNHAVSEKIFPGFMMFFGSRGRSMMRIISSRQRRSRRPANPSCAARRHARRCRCLPG